MKLTDINAKIARNVHFKTSERMTEIESSIIQSVICSPPYWNLKDYDHPEQIGHGETYERYLERMDRVWSECYRVLNDTGTMWIVVDKIWHNGELLHIPYDIACHCQRIGFILQDLIIWNKPTAIAGMNERNLVNKYEYVIFLSKAREGMKFNPLKGDRTPGFSRTKGSLTNLWRFPVKAGSIRKTPDHKAPYPEELIQQIVDFSTERGDIILDPYLGSGTTMKVALEHGRRCVGYEINPNFEDMIASRLKGLKTHSRQTDLRGL